MQFDFPPMGASSNFKPSKNLQQIIFELDKRSDASGKHQEQEEVNFSNFNPIQDDQKSADHSRTSELYNKPKQQSIPESNERPQFEFQEGSSRDIGQISYLYGQDESFRFDRSMSFEQEKKDNSRFERLKMLMSKAKINSMDAFYQNLQEIANQKNQGNIVFENKNQFKQYTWKMRVQKREQEAKFQAMMEQKKATQKEKTKSVKANLFGEQAFKKKQQSQNDFILPPEYSQDNDGDEFEVDFFNSGNQNQQNDRANEEDEYVKQKKQTYAKEAQQFFNFDSGVKQSNNIQNNNIRSNHAIKRPLEPIRQQKVTLLDTSVEQRKFQQLIQNYNSMKGNYKNLMQDLKHTSQSQYQLMQEMQKIKHNFNTQQQLKHSQTNSSQDKKEQQKKQEKQKIKQLKEQQLTQIKNQIHQIKATSTQKDLAYVKINEKIQQLEKLVRVALEEVQQEKMQHNNFTPKVINYFGDNYVSEQKESHPRSPKKSDRQDFSDHANLSQQASQIYEPEAVMNDLPSQQKFASTGGLKRQKQYNKTVHNTNKPSSKHYSKPTSNMPSYQGSIRRQFQQQPHSYGQRNTQKEPLNFIDEFSSPLQLDLSMGMENQNNFSSQSVQSHDFAFNPTEGALQYLPLQLDQTETKNLRSILTQKSSILFQSFEFLITVKYTMQQDDMYPVVGNLRVANKCAIDLLDVFVIVYGPQGQNVEVTPNKIFQERLKYNTNIFFEVKLDKMCIKDNGFNVQICYKTDSITKKKINFKALLPMVQLVRPEFCYEQNFLDTWDLFRNEIYIRPKKLNFKNIRNHEDLKLVLPFIHISQHDPNTFSYGLIFRYPKTQAMFMLKIACYINGKASVHLRADKNGDQPLKQELLNVINFLFLK